MKHLFVLIFVLVAVLFKTVLSQGIKCSSGLKRCDWENWSTWSSCSKSCGNGTQTRSRGLCCFEKDTFDECLTSCGIKDESLDSKNCGAVCPAGNCTFEKLNDTGIEATDYQKLYGDKPGLVINPPLHLLSTEKFCALSCREANLQNGMFCWTYTFSEKDKCYLHFYSKPLSLAHPELQGQSKGESVYLRKCTDTVECQATNADIVFIVDSSGSIGTENFQKMKVFLQNLVNGLDIDQDLARVGLLVFNDKMRWEFKIGDLNNKLDVLKAIQRIQYVVGGTLTSDALEKVRLEGFTANRTGVPMIAVVVTDGLSRYPPLTRFQASLLRKENVLVYAIGVGNSTNQNEIYNMASIPEEKYMYEFSSFDNLDANNVSLAVNYVKCKEKFATTPPSTEVTTVANNCTDLEPNCAGYGKDACTDYKPWAQSHCALYCGFCQGPSTSPEPCFDVLPNCDTYGQYYCENKEFVSWVNKNCRKFCGICTAPGSSTVTTQPTIATTTVRICQDTVDNCAGYLNSCNDDKYRGFLNERCPASCGYCQSHQTINGTTVNGVKCPDWYIPTECYMENVSPGCCPIPKCPDSTYVFTADKEK
ncbi:matrilin-2-like [Mercenaria mercenaria]|uniref:matrilin-2-like n=1 Tax=Mercenaria mercenaria TaxID=6596 RepID=UPI00234E7A26|nr:matrilin-2-like [Mercenaria mercenaria]